MSRRLLLLLALVSALGSLGIHAFVPALADVSRDLAVPPGLVQLGISLYMIGLMAGQLAGGWASDIFGRRPLLVAGGCLYALGAAACAIAPGIWIFLGGRIVQGIGGACALVVSRAVVADHSGDGETASRLAGLALVVLLAPTLAPLLGGVLVSLAGWRSIFVVLALVSLLALAATWIGIPRTYRREDEERVTMRAFLLLSRNGRFMRFATVNAIVTVAMFGFLGGATFLLRDQYRLGAAGTGLAFLFVAVSVMCGTVMSGRLERRRRGTALPVGGALIIAGGAVMLVAGSLVPHAAALVGPMMLVGLGSGLLGPATLAGALEADSRYRGTASSLFGALQMAVAAATTSIIAAVYRPTPLAIAIPVALSGVLLLPFLLANRRWTRPVSDR